ncbi:MAG: hypothetical protein C4337_03625 [Armatimonadota bacterium]
MNRTLMVKLQPTEEQHAAPLVAKAQDSGRGMAFEDLKGILERISVRKAQRRVPHSWGFHRLRSFIEYKARLAGVSVVCVDPRNTSRTCPACGHVSKANYAGRVSLRRVRLRWAGRRHRCGEHPQGRPYAAVRGGPIGLAASPWL